jgi:hypothetical protein
MNTFQILTPKFRFDFMHWTVSIGPEKWPIFGRFLTLFLLKRPTRRENNMAATVGDVMDASALYSPPHHDRNNDDMQNNEDCNQYTSKDGP